MEDAHSKPTREAAGGFGAVAMGLLFVAALPVLYVLGLGPVVWYVARSGQGPGVFEIIYAPLEWLAENSSLARDVLTWYVELWR